MIQLERILDADTFAARPALLTTRQCVRLTHGYHRLPEVNLLAIEVQHPDEQLSHALFVPAETWPDTGQRVDVLMEMRIPLANTHFRFCVSVQLCVTKGNYMCVKMSLDKMYMYCTCTCRSTTYRHLFFINSGTYNVLGRRQGVHALWNLKVVT